jgi:hypothetical protein
MGGRDRVRRYIRPKSYGPLPARHQYCRHLVVYCPESQRAGPSDTTRHEGFRNEGHGLPAQADRTDRDPPRRAGSVPDPQLRRVARRRAVPGGNGRHDRKPDGRHNTVSAPVRRSRAWQANPGTLSAKSMRLRGRRRGTPRTIGRKRPAGHDDGAGVNRWILAGIAAGCVLAWALLAHAVTAENFHVGTTQNMLEPFPVGESDPIGVAALHFRHGFLQPTSMGSRVYHEVVPTPPA